MEEENITDEDSRREYALAQMEYYSSHQYVNDLIKKSDAETPFPWVLSLIGFIILPALIVLSLYLLI